MGLMRSLLGLKVTQRMKEKTFLQVSYTIETGLMGSLRELWYLTNQDSLLLFDTM